jgi:hypothetical protein
MALPLIERNPCLHTSVDTVTVGGDREEVMGVSGDSDGGDIVAMRGVVGDEGGGGLMGVDEMDET